MKRKVSIIMAAVLSLTLLCSCGRKKESPTLLDAVKSVEQAKETVTDYLNSVKENGMSQAAGYLAATASNNSELADFYDIADSLKEELAAVAGDETAQEIVDSAISMASDKLSFNIKDAKEQEDGSVDVEAEIAMPDFESIDISDLDMLSVMEKIFGTTDQQELLKKFIERTGLSISDLAGYTDQNKLIADVFEAFKPELSSFFDELVGGVQTTVTTAHFTVKKQDDGSWKITETK